MMDIMYEVPSNDDISGCIITKDAVEKKSQPELKYKKNKPA